MGRKNRNKESKYKDDTLEVDEDDDNDVDKELALIEKIDTYQLNIIWETRKAMIQYCDDMSIPLCDYLTFKMFDDFMIHLESLK
jgi:hypothetical protein